MNPAKRIITELPLRELWDENGPISATCSRDLSAAGLRELLRQGPVRFVVADIGSKPSWVPETDCFDFWKREVQPHLAEPNSQTDLEQFPGGYCYFVAEWEDTGRATIVVLQRSH